MLRGQVKITEEFLDGSRKLLWNDPNLIVNSGRATSVRMLGEAVPPLNKYLSYIKVGTGGHAPGDTDTPVAPTVDDIALEDPTPVTVSMLSRVYVPPGVENAMQLIFMMDLAQGNGAGTVVYTEAMLFSADNTPFARETFRGAIKDATKKLYFEWLIM